MNFSSNAFDVENSIHSICSNLSNSSFVNPAITHAPGVLTRPGKGDKILLGKARPIKPKGIVIESSSRSPAQRKVRDVVVVPRTRFQASSEEVHRIRSDIADMVAENSFLSEELVPPATVKETQHVSGKNREANYIKDPMPVKKLEPAVKTDNTGKKVVTVASLTKPIPFVVTEVTDTSTKPRIIRLPPAKFKYVVTDKNNPLASKQKMLFENPKKRRVVRNYQYNAVNSHTRAIDAILSPRYERHALAAANNGSGDTEVDDFAVMFSSSTVLTPPAPVRPTQFGYRENVFAAKYTPPVHDLFTPAGLMFPDDNRASKPTTGKTAYFPIPTSGQECSEAAVDRGSGAVAGARTDDLAVGENAFDNESECGATFENTALVAPEWQADEGAGDAAGSGSFMEAGVPGAEEGELSMISQSGLLGWQEGSGFGDGEASASAEVVIMQASEVTRYVDDGVEIVASAFTPLTPGTSLAMEPTPAMEFRPPPGQAPYHQLQSPPSQPQSSLDDEAYHLQRSVELDPRLVREREKRAELEALRAKPERRIKKGTTGKGVYHWESAKPTKDHKRPMLRKKMVAVQSPQLSLKASIDVIVYTGSTDAPPAATKRPVPLVPTAPDPVLVRDPTVQPPAGFNFAELPASNDGALAQTTDDSSRPATTKRQGETALKTPITGVEIRRAPGASFCAQMSARASIGAGAQSYVPAAAVDAATGPALYRVNGADSGARTVGLRSLPVVNMNESLTDPSFAESVGSTEDLLGGASTASSQFVSGAHTVSAVNSIDITNPVPLVDQLPGHYIPITTVPLAPTLSPNKSHRKIAPGGSPATAVDCDALSSILTGNSSPPPSDRKNARPTAEVPNSGDDMPIFVGSGSGVLLHDTGLPGSKLPASRSSPTRHTGGSLLKPRPPVSAVGHGSPGYTNAISAPLTVKLSPTSRAKKLHAGASQTSTAKSAAVVIPSFVRRQVESGPNSKPVTAHQPTRPMTDADSPSRSKPATATGRPATTARPMTDATNFDDLRASPIPVGSMDEMEISL